MPHNLPKFTRRRAIQTILSGTAAGLCSRAFSGCSRSSTQDELSLSELDAIERVARAFMTKFDVPALSVAIAHHGRFLYESAFGFSNRDSAEPVTTNHLFRIASVTKPITSAAIFTLVERRQLRLSDRVFGSNSILSTKYGTPPYKSFIEEITIDHLLTHTCGGWDNSSDDPMFENPDMDHTQLISWTLDTKPLKNPPGTHYAYSNFGYCVLGRVIEHLSGRPYADYVQEAVLDPCGIHGMRIAGNTLPERLPEEVTYYDQDGHDPYGMNVSRMDSHGGWLATPHDLVLFLNHVDGFKTTPNILKPETVKMMTTPGSVNPAYASGWCVNSAPNWWHDGSLPGTTTIMVRTASGFCWAALTNTRRFGEPSIGLALDNMVWDMARKVKAWRA